MDFRQLYPGHFFARLKSSESIIVLAWPERNGFGIQPLPDVGSDKGTIFMYPSRFEILYSRVAETDPVWASAAQFVESNIQTKGGVFKTPHFDPPPRTQWS